MVQIPLTIPEILYCLHSYYMAALWYVLGMVTLEHPQKLLGNHSWSPNFVEIQPATVKIIIVILHSCQHDLKLPIHAPFCGT